MKIDYSTWIICVKDDSGLYVNIEKPSEGIVLYANMDVYTHAPGMTGDDPIKYIKELAKKTIKHYYVQQQMKYLNGKQISVEDNLDYIENEAERRGLA
jgi:hypothetical protein